MFKTRQYQFSSIIQGLSRILSSTWMQGVMHKLVFSSKTIISTSYLLYSDTHRKIQNQFDFFYRFCSGNRYYQIRNVQYQLV